MTTFEETLPFSLNVSKFDSELLTVPLTLKDFVHQYCHKRNFWFARKAYHYRIRNAQQKFLFQQLYYRYFSVCHCYNFVIGYDNSYVYTM